MLWPKCIKNMFLFWEARVLVEVFVPTFNSARTLRRCLDSIFLSVPDVEVTVIDKFSTDGTVDLVKEYPARLVQNGMNIAEARSFMFHSARGEWFLMVDSDAYVSPLWYSNLMFWRDKVLKEEPKTALLVSHIVEEPTVADSCLKRNLAEFFDWKERNLHLPTQNHPRPNTCVSLVRHIAVKDYSFNVPCYEDYVLARDLRGKGWVCWMVPAEVLHDELLDSERLKRRCRVVGASMKLTGERGFWNLLFASFYTPWFRAPWGIKQFVFNIYCDYVDGYLNPEKYGGLAWNIS